MKNSLKSKIRYWFLFLRLAHDFKDTMVTRSLKNSESLYSSWGNYQTESFENWWKKHSNLFREVSTVRVLDSKDSVTESDFVISIPYTLSPTAVGKMVASMYRKRQSERLTEKQPKSGKTKKVYKGEFTLTSPEYQVAQFAYYYLFAKEVYVPLKNTGDRFRNRDYLFKAKEVFGKLKRKTTEVREIPFTKQNQSNDAENKQIRRYVQYANQLLLNVSLGEFPGDYELKPRKTLSQVKQELEERKSREPGVKRKFSRGPKLKGDDRVRKESQKDNPFNPFSERKKRKDAGKKRK
jgi:hypothetical protein